MKEELEYTQVAAPLIGRGFIRFYNLRPDRKLSTMWCCDECGQRIVPSRFEIHAKLIHGWKSGRDAH